MPASDRPPIPNSYWVLPARVLAGEYPRAHIKRLIGAGIDRFIDLTQPDELEPYVDLLPKHVVHRRFPITDHSVPRSPEEMANILREIELALAAGATIYLHCRAGIGRTGTVAGCLLAQRGLSGAAALNELNRVWRECARSDDWDLIPETDEQAQFVRQWSDLESDRCVAAVVGLAIGDAFAAGGSASSEWTDDTAMVLCSIESLLEQRNFDPRDQIQRLSQWQHKGHNSASGTAVGVTPSTARAITVAQWRRQLFAGSHDPRQLEPEPLSRLTAIVLYDRHAPAMAISEAIDSARLTCQAPLVLDAVRVLSEKLLAALSGRPKARILAGTSLPGAPPLRGRLFALATGAPRLREPVSSSAPRVDAVDVLEAVLYSFAQTASFAEGLEKCCSFRGRKDVIAAAYGALAGAYYGLRGIPEAWRAELRKRELIEGLAVRLAASTP
jgi:ADP-ribosyl-[dinitrogen reductase] hydrolase